MVAVALALARVADKALVLQNLRNMATVVYLGVRLPGAGNHLVDRRLAQLPEYLHDFLLAARERLGGGAACSSLYPWFFYVFMVVSSRTELLFVGFGSFLPAFRGGAVALGLLVCRGGAGCHPSILLLTSVVVFPPLL